VQDEAASLVDGPAVVDADVAAAGRHLEAERPQRPLEGDLGHGHVDDEAERPVVVVAHDVDHRPGEPRVAERLGRDEQAPGERAAARRVRTSIGHRRQQEERCEQKRGHARRASPHPAAPDPSS
jgi:hypothetical protein